MNVLYLINHAGKAGTERYVELLVSNLSRQGVKPFFAYNEAGLLVEKIKAMDVPCRQITMTSPYDKAAAKALAALCEEWDIDLVHTHYLRENYITMRAKRYNKKIKGVYTNHFVMDNNFITRLSNRVYRSKQDEMIAVCNIGKETLVNNGWSREKIRVVHNGVDPAMWRQDEPSTMREELGIGADEFVFFCASRFAYDKGHKYLIDSIARLLELTDRPFRLVLAGDGELLEPSKAQVAKLGLEEHVLFAGFRRDLKNLLHGSDIYVNASEHEALSFSIIEAMAAGLPIVATDMGGNSDIINDETDCGILVTYDDPESMAQGLLRMMTDAALLERCRENAARAIEAEFSVDIMCARTLQCYFAALGVSAEAGRDGVSR